MAVGKVYFVGAGPGDPGLLTLKGRRCIERADVIIYDRLVNPILLQLSARNCELIYVGKDPDKKYIQQQRINELIVKYAEAGKIVTRLKGGDVAVFGRLTEEMNAVRHLHYEVVPGITSASAAAIYSGIPLTDREYSAHVTLSTGHLKNDSTTKIDIHALTDSGTLALYMGMSHLTELTELLLTHGEDLPIAIIGSGTYGYQNKVTGRLSTIVQQAAAAEVKHPAMIIIGQVVLLSEQFDWFEALPGFGKSRLIVSSSVVDKDAVLLEYDSGCFIYVIDQLSECRMVEKYKELHERVLDEFTFSEISYMDDQAEILFARNFPGGLHTKG